MSFEDRTRFKSFQEALDFTKECPGWICHILKNGDADNYSVMRHINVEWCRYCDQRNAAFNIGLRYSDEHPLVHVAVPDPYKPCRDLEHPCEDFDPGKPDGDCASDGHCMCRECKHMNPEVVMLDEDKGYDPIGGGGGHGRSDLPYGMGGGDEQ